VINPGDSIVNPITGERVVFHKTSTSTNGECVEIEVFVQPGGVVASAHLHPYQTERFEILGGTIGMKVGRKKVEARYGDVVRVEPGAAHTFWNAGHDQLHFVCVISPALQFEQLLETMFALAADGKTNGKGMPSPLRLAVIAKANFDTVRLPLIPAWMQRGALAFGAPVGRLAGYEATYAPTGGVPALA